MGVIEKARENKVEFSQKMCFQEAKIRRMLAAVVAHSPKEELLVKNYMEECPRVIS